MATSEDETTDRHDEPDTAQFGDDPHHLNNTAFEEAACTRCGTYVAKARTYTGPCYCSDCGRINAGIHTAYTPPPKTRPTQPKTQKPQTTEWQWGCIECLATGPARNAAHALQQEAAHHCQRPGC